MESCGRRPLLGTYDRPFAMGRRRDRDHHHGWMSDEELIARLRDLVLRGEYRDDLYGRPGENLDGASALRLDGAPDAWGSKDALQGARREYRRGSPDYQAAKAAGLVDPLPPLERATSAKSRQPSVVSVHLCRRSCAACTSKSETAASGRATGSLGSTMASPMTAATMRSRCPMGFGTTSQADSCWRSVTGVVRSTPSLTWRHPIR